MRVYRQLHGRSRHRVLLGEVTILERRCNTIPIKLVPRAGAIRDTRGIAKMVIDVDTNHVLGVSLVMRDAGEVIHEAAMGLRLGATLDDFIDLDERRSGA